MKWPTMSVLFGVYCRQCSFFFTICGTYVCQDSIVLLSTSHIVLFSTRMAWVIDINLWCTNFVIPLIYFQINFFKNHKEEKHWRVFLCSLRSCTLKLSTLHLVWIAHRKLQMGKLPCCNNKWLRHLAWIYLHSHIFLVCFSKREGKLFGLYQSTWEIIFLNAFVTYFIILIPPSRIKQLLNDLYIVNKWPLILKTKNAQMKVAATTIPVITIFCITVAISSFALHDHHQRKVFVGSVGLVASVAMYGSPLVVVVCIFSLFHSRIHITCHKN